MKIVNKLKTAGRLLREKGPDGIRQKFAGKRRRRLESKRYAEWLKTRALTAQDRENIRREIASFRRKPLISIILPVYDVGEIWLRRCLETVLGQLYENWELCVADDKSPSPHIARVLREFASSDARIKVVFRNENGHISAASNSALALATGEFCVLLDHDDELSEDALFHVAKELNDHPETAFVYSDEDVIDETGRRYEPKFKPDFSRDLFYSLNMVTHLSAYRTDVLRDVGGFREGFEGSQDYDLALRVIERIDESRIRHIPKILYHWRAIAGSVALSGDEKPYAHERAREALREHLERTGREATVGRGVFQFHHVSYPFPSRSRISIVRWSVDDANVSVENGDSPAVLLADEGSDLSTAAALNNAAQIATGDFIVFCASGIDEIRSGAFEKLASFVSIDEIGVAGGRVSDHNGVIVEAGFIIGGEPIVRKAHEGETLGDSGSFFRLTVENNFSAVSAVCFAVSSKLFGALGGFNATDFPKSLFDVDFCLRVIESGRRVVFTPSADFKITREEIRNRRDSAAEETLFRERWPGFVERDPFYNPNLSRRGEPFKIL